MRSARRGMRYAVLGFALVSGVVVAGMSWATVATVRLKESEIKQELAVALWRLDGYLTPILAKEAGRDFYEYAALHIPHELRSSEGHKLDPSEYEDYAFPSRLTLDEPTDEWIELYFQVDQDGAWSSPQVLGPDVVLEDSPYANAVTAHRMLSTFQWLQSVLTRAKLDAVAGRALACTCPLRGLPGHENCDCLCAMRLARGESRDSDRAVLQNEYEWRQRRRASSQLKSLPSVLCLPRDVSIEASLAPMEALWLDPGEGEGLKLAFLRTWYLGSDVFHQGFVVDWNRLRLVLLAEIADLFPDADLQPILSETDTDQAMRVTTLKARLVVPAVSGGARAAAWRSVRGTLFGTWATALAVLVAAGWGIRNLVALTERRMQFAYAVTHELRTPLTTFRLYSDMLSAGLVPESSKQEYLDTLNVESLRLSRVVEGVLEYARVENQKVRLNPIETDASSLHEAIRESLEERCRKNGVEGRSTNEIPDQMPLRADVELVSRIAGVLLDNACRHAGKLGSAHGGERASPARRGSAVVAVRLSGENGRIYLDVIDSGPGVERRDARTIFKPFRRGRGADAAAKGGIGLGLALARSWARLMGGRLNLVARHHPKHGGAHFRLTIPARLPSSS